MPKQRVQPSFVHSDPARSSQRFVRNQELCVKFNERQVFVLPEESSAASAEGRTGLCSFRINVYQDRFLHLARAGSAIRPRCRIGAAG